MSNQQQREIVVNLNVTGSLSLLFNIPQRHLPKGIPSVSRNLNKPYQLYYHPYPQPLHSLKGDKGLSPYPLTPFPQGKGEHYNAQQSPQTVHHNEHNQTGKRTPYPPSARSRESTSPIDSGIVRGESSQIVVRLKSNQRYLY